MPALQPAAADTRLERQDSHGPRDLPVQVAPRIAGDRLLVRFADDVSPAEARGVARDHDAAMGAPIGATGFVTVLTNGRSPGQVRRGLSRDPRVESVEMDTSVRAFGEPGDPLYASQQKALLSRFRFPAAWDRAHGSGVTIAVLDTGVRSTHEDIVDAIAPGTVRGPDVNGHGTMVAGIAAASTDNGKGIAGAGWGAQIMTVMSLNSDGHGWSGTIAGQVTRAVDEGADVINMSFGSPRRNEVLAEAVRYALDRGAVVVAAAGDTGDDEPQYPAAYPGVIAVGATDHQGRLTHSSTHGDWVSLAAPGWDVPTTTVTTDTSYGTGTGTSFSAALVSGAAALVRARHPEMSATEIAQRLTSTARDAGPRGPDPYYGYGIVDPAAALGQPAGAPFPLAAGDASEPDESPGEARRRLTLDTAVTGTIAPEGDRDWYVVDVPYRGWLDVTVTPTAVGAGDAQGMDPAFEFYDSDMQLLEFRNRVSFDSPWDRDGPGVAERALVPTPKGGRYYLMVRSVNGSTASDYRVTASVDGPGDGFLQWEAVISAASRLVVHADVTGDRIEDVIVANDWNGGGLPEDAQSLLVWPGRRDGSLDDPVRYQTGSGTVAGLAVADLDGDGLNDVATGLTKGVRIFRQTPAGTLADQGVVPLQSAGTMLAGDVDADGRVDLVTGRIRDQGFPETVTFLHNDGNLQFTSSVANSGALECDIELADITGDGRLDLVACQGSAVRVYPWTDAGFGSPQLHETTGVSATVDAIDAGDVDGDGDDDVVAALGADADARLNVFTQQAGGGLSSTPATLPVTARTTSVLVDDVTGDGRQDVALAHLSADEASVIPQRASGELGVAHVEELPSTDHALALSVGDIDRNGAPDLLAAVDGGFVYSRQSTLDPTPRLRTFVRRAWPPANETGVLRDVNPRVIFQPKLDPASVDASTVRLLDASGNPVDAAVVYDPAENHVTITPVARLAPGRPYVLVVKGVRAESGQVMDKEFRSSFTTIQRSPTMADPWDFNGDGYADLAVGAPGEAVGTVRAAGSVTVMRGGPNGPATTGAMAFSQQTTGIAGTAEQGDRFGSALASEDFDGDGYADLAIGVDGENVDGLADGGMVHVLFGSPKGLGADRSMTITPSGLPAFPKKNGLRLGRALAAGDMTGRPYGDLGMGAPGGDVVVMATGGPDGFDGNYSITDESSLCCPGGHVNEAESFGASLAAGDVDGDGRTDLAIGMPAAHEEDPEGYPHGAVAVCVEGGVGACEYWSKQSPGVNGEYTPCCAGMEDTTSDRFGEAVAFGDFDGNGRDDLAVGSPGTAVGGTRAPDAGAVNILYSRGADSISADGDRYITQSSAGVPGAARDGNHFGAALATGDYNGDGFEDLAVAAPATERVTLFWGSADGLTTSGAQIWSQASAGVPDTLESGDGFGTYLRTVPFSSGRLPWLAVGVPGENSAAGAVTLLPGSSTGLTGTGSRTLTQNSSGVPGSSETGDRWSTL